MKSILIIILLFAIQSNIYGQWIEQNSGTIENLNEVKFVSENTGYIVGDKGIMLKTNDGGNNWNSINIESSENLTSVWFVNEATGFVGGEAGFLAKTENGGDSWELLDLNLTKSIEIYFINNTIGFIGTANTIYKTIDGGDNWNEVDLLNVRNFNQIYEIEFVTNTIGYALNKIGILKTNDGGQTWTQIIDDSHPDYNGANILTSCAIINEEVAHFGSPYYWGLYSTIDGGGSLSFKELQIDAIEFPTPKIGFAIDSLSLSIIKTEDGGENWFSIFVEDEFK